MIKTKTAVNSAAATHIDHDAEGLHVTYSNGKDYLHPGVPAELHAQLMDGRSIGQFLSSHIRKQYPGVAK